MGILRAVCLAAVGAVSYAGFLAPLQAAGSAPPSAPADATYQYVITQAGKQIGRTSVVVKREATMISLHEVETIASNDGQYIVDETLEPVSLTPTGYTATFPFRGPTVTLHVRFDKGGASETVDGTSGTTDLRLLSGTSHEVVVDGAWMSGFLMLPAQVKTQRLDKFTALTPSNPSPGEFVGRVISATLSRPSAVPASDVSLSVSGPVNFDVWYDPQTMVVDEVDVASQQVTISRSHG